MSEWVPLAGLLLNTLIVPAIIAQVKLNFQIEHRLTRLEAHTGLPHVRPGDL